MPFRIRNQFVIQFNIERLALLTFDILSRTNDSKSLRSHISAMLSQLNEHNKERDPITLSTPVLINRLQNLRY